MNRNQAIALLIAAINIVVILLFPPFDIYGIANSQLPIFGGFNFYFSANAAMKVNESLLFLELIVILINTCISWLLLREKKREITRRRFNLQNATLIVVAVNLVLIVLFPPFESVFAISKAAIPSFEGFYFIFARQPHHVIVSAILYLEVIFVLVNGGLFWLVFREKKPEVISPEEALALMMEMKKRGN
jgi:hypothetical protein